MVNGITWEEQTLTRIDESRKKQKQAQLIAEQKLKEANHFGEHADLLEKAIELERQHRDFIQIEQLSNRSTWDNLMTVMSANKGMLVVIDAVSFLVDMKVYEDRERARHAIYSTLHNHKKDVEYIRKGVYRLKEIGDKHPNMKDMTHHQQQSNHKGKVKKPNLHLKEKIEPLMASNPNLTRDEVLNILIRNGVFQGIRYPKKALAMAWVSLGYAKEGKQQVLPIANLPLQ